MKNAVAVSALAAAALGALGCHHEPPPVVAPQPMPIASAPLPPPPPPAPLKCEAMAEGCKGPATARIRRSGFSIAVPEGWAYAQQEDATVIARDEAMLVLTTYETNPTNPAFNDASREQAFQLVTSVLGVSTVKRVAWGRPVRKSKVGSLEMHFWQANDVTKGLRRGPMLVMGTPLLGTWILAVGFVPDDDRTDADKTIIASVESIAPSPPPSPLAPPAAVAPPPVLAPPPPMTIPLPPVPTVPAPPALPPAPTKVP